ncbi:MAG: hypothetical protein M1834_001591 [Cirrosporium novae-zelandiae]|nr:MAG: hypothetical protein M1834_004108 [Cirrosporium novae-zelandiae]KAI9735575.1 MAG: hypothetical protein M1834_001591 [Cirrosporium novae-zelandiae]
MVKYYDSVPDNLRDWMLDQPVFFTASAPTTGKHINISPKGLPSSTFTIFTPNLAAYIDATGSGCETISHIYENGRITIMFCSFEASPRIMRLFCTGRVVEWDQLEFQKLLGRMGGKKVEGARAVIVLDIFKVQTSCGYGVPLLTLTPTGSPYLRDRETMGHWASKKVATNQLHAYQAEWNHDSLDGLTGLKTARRDHGEKVLWVKDAEVVVRGALGRKDYWIVAGLASAGTAVACAVGMWVWGLRGVLHE